MSSCNVTRSFGLYKLGKIREFLDEIELKIDSNKDFQQLVTKFGPGNLADYALSKGLAVFASIFMLDSYDSVVQCKSKRGESETCTNRFLNRMTDFGWCFTVQPGNNTLSGYNISRNKPSLTQENHSDVYTAYGMNETDNQPLKFSGPGSKNGLQLVLNAHSEENCGSTTGFKVLLHNPDVQPMFSFGKSFEIATGEATNVAISLRSNKRNTRDYGYCMGTYAYTVFELSNYYQDACFSDCLIQRTYRTLGCIPNYTPNTKFPNGKMPCNISAQTNFHQNLLKEGIGKYCRDCRKPCEEIFYDFTLSTSIFPSENSQESLEFQNLKPFGMSVAEFRKNYLLVNFFLGRLEYPLITEDIEMSITDLLNALGGAISLFLGASLISVMEVLFCVVNCLSRCCWRFDIY